MTRRDHGRSAVGVAIVALDRPTALATLIDFPMYATCLFCNTHLGANEAIPTCPVGRRLAFDPAKGRLWVVCARCGRWNLTPLDERWEAIEGCERLFRATRLRVSTDNIALAQTRVGLELVRIGPALFPEIASWRYGARLRRLDRDAPAGGLVRRQVRGGTYRR